MLLFAFNVPPDPAPDVPVVLLVEDHVDTRQMYAEFLKSSFEILQAGDATQALQIARSRRLALVVTDLSLPGMDGFELIAVMRQDPATAGVPMVCLSGFGGSATEERARQVGCDRIIQKPCLPDVLAQTIFDLLDEVGQGSHS